MHDSEVIEFNLNKVLPQSLLLKIFPIYPAHSTLIKRNKQHLHELITLYQTTRLAYEHNQRLHTLIRPFLSQNTWREANKLAWGNGQTWLTETQEVSILCLDVANFTELLDNNPLDQVLTDLNTYLAWLTHIVHDYHGDIDKYLGDGFLAVFSNADDAIQAGCALQQAATNFNRDQKAQNGLIFPPRIGLDSGPVAFISLGSTDRQDRTVMGMPVNFAERLQAQAIPGQVLFSQATFARLQDQSGCHCLGPIEVKGRTEPLIVYEKEGLK